MYKIIMMCNVHNMGIGMFDMVIVFGHFKQKYGYLKCSDFNSVKTFEFIGPYFIFYSKPHFYISNKICYTFIFNLYK